MLFKLMKISKKELKIFLTFFIIYSIFICWIGSNELSSFNLTRAMIDQGRLDIDSYYNNTVDRSLYNDHYYSNKANGASLLASPIYASWKFIYNNFFPQSFIDSNKPMPDYQTFIVGNNVELVDYVNFGFFIKISMILITVFTSCLLSSLTVLLLYKISKYFTKNERHRIMLIIIYGLGTLAFPYATVFFIHSITTFFLFLSFYFLFKLKIDGEYKYIIFAGFTSGYAIIVDNFSFLISLLLLIYLLTYKRDKKVIITFLIFNFVAIAPLLSYNYLIFHTPFESIYRYGDTTIWYSESWLLSRNTAGFTLSFEPFRILRLLFFPHIGLFFYYPILILSFYGLVSMEKKYRVEKLFIITSFLSALILISMFVYWWGINIGPRYLLITLPFFVLPIFYSFNKIDFKIVSILLIISFLVNVSNTGNWGSVSSAVIKTCCEMNLFYANKINSFQILINPIFEKNIFGFFNFGPRSRLIESFLVDKWAFDVREDWPYVNSMEEPKILNIKLFTLNPFGLVFMKVSLIVTLIVFTSIFLIWKKSAANFILRYKYLFIILFLLFLFYFFNIENTVFEKNWYKEEKDQTGEFRWMSDNATLNLYSPSDSLVRINFTARSFDKNRTMIIYKNNQIVFLYNLTVDFTKITTPFLRLSSGENVIKLQSSNGCDTKKNETRCLSFALKNVVLLKSNIAFSNWYSEEEDQSVKFRWIGKESNITYYSLNETKAELRFDVKSYYKNRELDVYVNDVFVNKFQINSFWNSEKIEINVNQEDNYIKFFSADGCDVPKQLIGLNDTRCLSFAFRNIEIQELK